MLVGEALGRHEEEEGEPFVGDAGNKLNYLLQRAGLKRSQVLIGNTVRCRPPKNRKPSRKEIDACSDYLLYDVLKHKPAVIVALGSVAYNALHEGKAGTLDHHRGFPVKRTFHYFSKKRNEAIVHTCWLVPTYHPSAALHDWTRDDLIVFDLKVAAALGRGEQPLSYPETKVNVVQTITEAKVLFSKLRAAGLFVVDLETTGLNPHTDKVMCVGFCYRAGEAHILPIRKHGGELCWQNGSYQEVVGDLADVLAECRVAGQNIKFDMKFLRKLTGVAEYNVVFDTQNAHHVIDENRPHNLTFMAQQYLHWDKYDEVMDQYKTTKRTMADAPDDLLWRYCGYDVDATWQLMRKFMRILKEEKTNRALKTELGLINCLADVEFRGIHVNKKKMIDLSTGYRARREEIITGLQRLAVKKLGPEYQKFNPQSPAQLATLLDAVGARLYKKTAGGAASTDKLVLAALGLRQDKIGTLAREVQELRTLGKYVSTYLDGKEPLTGGFYVWIQDKDRIHANYNVTVARTGRLSANDPPIQTIPRTGGLRGIFEPDVPQRDVFISVDYSGIELRVMAWLANDEVMAPELINGVDLHRRMAVTAKLMRDPTEEEWEKMGPEITKQERAIAKGVNFGIPYGRGAASIVDANPDAFPAKMRKQVRVEKVERVIEAYFEKYWGVRLYMEHQVELAKRRRYLRTYTVGRKRRFPGMDWFDSDWATDCYFRDTDLQHLEREAQNFQIQSIASDTLSGATRRCYEGIKASKIPHFRIVMTLHDQLVFNCPRPYVEEAKALVLGWMECCLPKDKKHRYEMPLKVDCNVQRFWGEDEYE